MAINVFNLEPEPAGTLPSGSTNGDTTTTFESLLSQAEPLTGLVADSRDIDVSEVNENPSMGSLDPSEQRLMGTNAVKGGIARRLGESYGNEIPVAVRTSNGYTSSEVAEDWRVRISLATNARMFYKSTNPGIQSPLINTSGVVFPYTPSISVSHTARYGETKLTHSNYASYFYEGSDVSAITISSDFTVQTVEEGKYVLAALTFFRSCTKMFFGSQVGQPLAGNPPPMVFLNGYGKLYFPNVPCVITNFTHTMPPEVDYIEIKHSASEVNPTGVTNTGGVFKSELELLNNAATRVPTSSTISITVQPVYSRKFVHESFNLDSFASGELLITRGGFI